MPTPVLTIIAYVSLVLGAAASPITVSTSTSVPGTSFDGDTPPQSHMFAGLAGGVAIAGLVIAIGVVGTARYCSQKREMDRKRRYREYQEERASEGEACKGLEEIGGIVEDGFRFEDGEWPMGMPKTPPPSYAGSVRREDIELEATPWRKGGGWSQLGAYPRRLHAENIQRTRAKPVPYGLKRTSSRNDFLMFWKLCSTSSDHSKRLFRSSLVIPRARLEYRSMKRRA